MYRSILVPLDGSLPSEQSLPYATALARRSGAALQLAYVHTPLLLGEGTMYLGTPVILYTCCWTCSLPSKRPLLSERPFYLVHYLLTEPSG
jgi:hypothetical protein